jgi:hypothetical protein
MWDPLRASDALSTFKSNLQWLHPEIWEEVEKVHYNYIVDDTGEFIVLSFCREYRDIFEALSKQPNIEALREAAREAKINVKLKLGTEEVLITFA